MIVRYKYAVMAIASCSLLAACGNNSVPSGGSLAAVGTGPSTSPQATSSAAIEDASATSAPTPVPSSRDDSEWVQSRYPDCSGGLCAVFERAAPEAKITIVTGSGAMTPDDGFETCGLVRSQDAYCRRISSNEEIKWPVNGQVDVLAGGHREVLAGGQRKSSRSGLLAGGAVGEAVAVAGGGDDVGVVAEPVEQADGGGLVGQEASPVLERAV